MWFTLCLSTALFVSIADAMAKKFLESRTPATVALIRSAWSSLFLLCGLFLTTPPSSPLRFWILVLAGIPLEVTAALAFNNALQIAPLSLMIPYMAFTPVFLLIGGWIFLGEHISLTGGLGIACVAGGAALLQAPLVEAGTSHFQRLIPREKAPALMLLVAFIYAVTSILARRALTFSTPQYFCGVYFPLIAVGLLPFQLRSGDGLKKLIDRPHIFIWVGSLDAAALIAQFLAFQMAQVAYVMALKRLSLLLSVLWGWFFFHEQKSWIRLAGAILMALGAGLIALRNF